MLIYESKTLMPEVTTLNGEDGSKELYSIKFRNLEIGYPNIAEFGLENELKLSNANNLYIKKVIHTHIYIYIQKASKFIIFQFFGKIDQLRLMQKELKHFNQYMFVLQIPLTRRFG